MLMGINGFYLYKNAGDLAAVEQLAQALDELENGPPPEPLPPSPTAIFATDDPAAPRLASNLDAPSFAEMFRRDP